MNNGSNFFTVGGSFNFSNKLFESTLVDKISFHLFCRSEYSKVSNLQMMLILTEKYRERVIIFTEYISTHSKSFIW